MAIGEACQVEQPIAKPHRMELRLEPIMRHATKTIIAVSIAVVVTAVMTSYFVRKATIQAFASGVFKMEAINGVGEVELWGREEKLLAKGCNKQALQFAKNNQSQEFEMLKSEIGGNAERKDTQNDPSKESNDGKAD